MADLKSKCLKKDVINRPVNTDVSYFLHNDSSVVLFFLAEITDKNGHITIKVRTDGYYIRMHIILQFRDGIHVRKCMIWIKNTFEYQINFTYIPRYM